MQIFCNILIWILYEEITGEGISRQEFLFQLEEELAIERQEEQQVGKGGPAKAIKNITTCDRKNC